jgi:fluoride exporter
VILYIALGGVVGTLARYFLQGWVQQRSGLASFPVGTLAINLVGSFILGFVVRLATGSTIISPDTRAALTIGFCGAFTTMSTFSYESMKLLSDGEYWLAGMYMGGTVIGCLAAVIAGTELAGRVL